MSKKPTIVDGAEAEVSSSSVIAARSLTPKPRGAKHFAVCAAVVGLLSLAGLGVIFTIKHRMPRTPPAPANSVVVAPSQVVVDSRQANEVGRTKRVAVVLIPHAEPLPSKDANQNKPAFSGDKKSIATAIETAAEELTVLPRTAPETPMSAAKKADPAVAAKTETRPDPTTESKQSNPMPLVVIDNGKPKNDAAAQFPATEPPSMDALSASFGTKIDFLTDAEAAFKLARQRNQLVLVIYYSGSFAKGSFTCAKAEELRKECLLDPEVAEYLKPRFVCVCQSIGEPQMLNGEMMGGNVATYFCHSNRTVYHAIAGPVNAESFLAEARWIRRTLNKATTAMKRGNSQFVTAIRNAQREKYFEEGGPGFNGNKSSLPLKCPDDLAVQTQVHWHLAAWRGELPSLKDASKRVHEVILKERIKP